LFHWLKINAKTQRREELNEPPAYLATDKFLPGKQCQPKLLQSSTDGSRANQKKRAADMAATAQKRIVEFARAPGAFLVGAATALGRHMDFAVRRPQFNAQSQAQCRSIVK
jgi:hypothetical protein